MQHHLTKIKEEQEKREELDLYIKVQELRSEKSLIYIFVYVDFVAKVEMAREELENKYKALEEKYEQKHHALLIEEVEI